jgi:hypothetical protein
MVVWMRVLGALGCMLLISACSALAQEDPAATLRAEREGYIAEATQIADASLAQATYVIETAVAAATNIRQIEARNALLLETMRAAIPPTRQMVDNSGEFVPGLVASPAPSGGVAMPASGADVPAAVPASAGGSAFVDVATSTSVRASDGCADGVTSSFPAAVRRIYATTRATSISAGTVMRVQWTYQGAPAFSEQFTVSRNQTNYCLWFFIEPTAEVLSPGNWTVQLFANDQPIEPVVSFTIGM